MLEKSHFQNTGPNLSVYNYMKICDTVNAHFTVRFNKEYFKSCCHFFLVKKPARKKSLMDYFPYYVFFVPIFFFPLYYKMWLIQHKTLLAKDKMLLLNTVPGTLETKL